MHRIAKCLDALATAVIDHPLGLYEARNFLKLSACS